MTEQDFYTSIKALATETKKLQKNANKLADYAKRKNKEKSKALFVKIAYDTKQLKKLYNDIQNWAYWNTGKLDQEEWKLFTKEFDGFFNSLDAIIESIRARNGVIN